jgi:hypothetical protein
VIGVVSLGGAIALVVTCEDDGFCDFDHDAFRLSTAIGLGTIYVVNSVWSILTAVNDAEQHNAELSTGAVSLRPALERFVTTLPDGRRSTRLGVQLLNVSF